MLVIAVIVQLFVLLAVSVGLLVARSGNYVEAGVRVFAAWAVVLGLFLAGVWYYPGPSVRWIIVVAFLIISYLHFRRSHQDHPTKILHIGNLTTLVSIALGGVLVWQGVSGQSKPDVETIDLVSPMDEPSRICALSGGSSAALNMHFFTSVGPAGAFERYSVDFVKHDARGNRTGRFNLHPQPETLDVYLTYNEPVFASCDGTVVAAVDDKEDHPAGARFRRRDGSNLVTLRCGDIDIVLAHLKKGSVEVEVGQRIGARTRIGTIGHSGNSEEPHLHINAQTVINNESDSAFPQPVVMTFNGKYLARGDCIN
jgi:hypothetical protein